MQYQMEIKDKTGFQIKIRHIVLPLVLAILFYVFYVLYYVGAYKSVEISKQTAGPFILLYQEHFGPYHKIVPVIEKVEAFARENKIDCQLSFGKYLDDPSVTEESRLRSIGGCLLENAPNELSLPKDLKMETIAPQQFVHAEFQGSAGIGPFKVYPKVMDYFLENRLEKETWVLEVYEIHSDNAMTTKYYFPIKNGP